MHGGELTIHSVVTIFHFGSKKQLGRNLPCDGRRGLTGWARLFHPFHSVFSKAKAGGSSSTRTQAKEDSASESQSQEEPRVPPGPDCRQGMRSSAQSLGVLGGQEGMLRGGRRGKQQVKVECWDEPGALPLSHQPLGSQSCHHECRPRPSPAPPAQPCVRCSPPSASEAVGRGQADWDQRPSPLSPASTSGHKRRVWVEREGKAASI